MGAPQESHHHHVEGLSAKGDCEVCGKGPCTNECKKPKASGPFALASRPDAHGHHHHGHDHDHDHDHEHGHTHAPYPHADHPLGPVTLKK